VRALSKDRGSCCANNGSLPLPVPFNFIYSLITAMVSVFSNYYYDVLVSSKMLLDAVVAAAIGCLLAQVF
jgi:hypothetical protein